MLGRSKRLTINLRPQDPFLESPVGRFMQWSMGAGRYIIIFTEIIVILSFAARFMLDRQVTDLNSELENQIHTIEGYQELEAKIKLVQEQTSEIKKQKDSNNMLQVFETVSALVPLNVSFSKLSITPTNISVEGLALSQQAFSILVNNMQLSSQLHNIRIGKIESSGENSSGLLFTLSADTREAPVVSTPAKSSESDPATKTNILENTNELPL